MADTMSIDKKDPMKEDSEGSMSSPEGETGPNVNNTQEHQQPKRKGGRKPIYATSEERKQRNRQAQAAFRERRTEYIKQLEETIRVHEGNLQNLNAAHRLAAEECLMLRYKNSLLERILIEKDIDVQSELRAKTGSPSLGPTDFSQGVVQPPPIPRTIMNRHQPRRSNSSIAPKIEPGLSQLPPPLQPQTSAPSPRNRPTPPSHTNSPSAVTVGFGGPAALSPAPSVMHKQQLSPLSASNVPTRMPAAQAPSPQCRGPTPSANSASFYPTPSFQNHIEQLEQEYDAQADMMDDADIDTPSGPGPYPNAFGNRGEHMTLSPPSTTPGSQIPMPTDVLSPPQTTGQQYPSMTQLLDSGDWDPFGLSASMAFPTQFSFDHSNLR